jgi:hypothetical protein
MGRQHSAVGLCKERSQVQILGEGREITENRAKRLGPRGRAIQKTKVFYKISNSESPFFVHICGRKLDFFEQLNSLSDQLTRYFRRPQDVGDNRVRRYAVEFSFSTQCEPVAQHRQGNVAHIVRSHEFSSTNRRQCFRT